MKKIRVVSVIVLMVSLIFISGMVPGISRSKELSGSGVNIYISGDQEVLVNETNTYEATIGGVFGEEEAQNWTLNSKVIDGMATVSAEKQESNTSNVFEVEMTAMEKGTVTIEFEGYCSDGDETRREVETFEVDVLEVTTTSVLVTNPSDTVIEDVKVGLFIGGELKKVEKIDKLEVDGSERVQFNWSKEGLEPGEHKMEIWLDYGYEQDEDFNKEDLLLEKSIYIPDEGEYTLYTALVVLLIIGVIGAFFYYQHKRKKRRRPW
ncbi:MAG: hypothetical protein R6W73_05165 [Candidatus Saliniplasma sp.]